MPNNRRAGAKIILGIDPGYDRLGLAVLEKSPAAKEKIIYSECFTTDPKQPIGNRFRQIGETVARIIEDFSPDEVAIENLFLANNQKTAMRVAETRGIIIYEAARHGLPFCEYTPMQIKVAVTGDGKSDKSRIMKMIPLLIKLPAKNRLDDEYDAIAVALTHAVCVK